MSPTTPTSKPPAVATTRTAATHPCTVIIFGASGDLTRRKLLPALYNLLLDGLLPENFAVLGLGRKRLSDEDFRNIAREGIEQFSRQSLQSERWDTFHRRLFFCSGDLSAPEYYGTIRERLNAIETQFHLPNNRIFYLAIPPTSFAPACEGLQQAGLVAHADAPELYSRVIVEKPIGHDLASAQAINTSIGQVFHESQIYRIDHYLGKETVQNIMVMRFANSIFEPLWNHNYIDHVQLTVSEAVTLGSRAAYYEGAGALRDMIQNHILQLMCLIAMEPPYSLDPDVVRNARMDVLRGLRPIRGKEVKDMTVRAQYSHGTINGKDVPGYRREEGVQPDSTTETYVALKVFLENWRWAGVPFYIRTGKAMPKRASEIAVQFKEIPQILFNANPQIPQAPNLLKLRIQPEEGMAMRIISKVPGTKAQTHPVQMDFQYGDAFDAPSPEAYERLLFDVMEGDTSLFMRRDAVEASWAWVTDILEGWQDHGTKWLPEYPAGSWGPIEADRLIQTDGHQWREV